MNTQKKNAIVVISTFVVITIIMVLLIPVELKHKRYEEFGKLAVAAETDDRAEYIIKNSELYPEHILKLYYSDDKNFEFVYNYPFLKGSYATMSYTNEELSGIPSLYMYDPRWGYEYIGNSTDIIKTTGCAYVSLTMAYIGLTGNGNIDPVILGRLAYDNSLTAKLDASLKMENVGTLCNMIGLNGTYYNFDTDREGKAIESIDEIAQHISDDSVVFAGMYGDVFGSHAIIIRECDGNNVYINDPAEQEKTEKTWTFDEIKSELKGIWVITRA